MSKNDNHLAALTATLPDSMRENPTNTNPSNTGKPDERLAFDVTKEAQNVGETVLNGQKNITNALGQLVSGSSIFVGYTAGNGPAKNHGHFLLVPINGKPAVTYSAKPFKLGKLAAPVMGVGGIKFSVALVGTVNTQNPGNQEGGISFTAVLPRNASSLGVQSMVFINLRATSLEDFNFGLTDRSGRKFRYSANFGAGISASDAATIAGGAAFGASISTVPGLQLLGPRLGYAWTQATQMGLDSYNANAWVGLAGRAEITMQNGLIVSMKIGDFEVPFSQIAEFAIKAYEEGRKLAGGINDHLNKIGITIFNDTKPLPYVKYEPLSEIFGTESRSRELSEALAEARREAYNKPDVKPQTQLPRQPEAIVLGKNRGGPLQALSYNDLVKNQNSVATDVISYIYQNVNLPNTFSNKPVGFWTTSSPIPSRPGEEFQIRLSPKDRNVLEMRFTDGGKTYGYSAHLGSDGRFKVEGDRKLRDLPPYLEDRVRGIDRSIQNNQTGNPQQKEPEAQRITSSDDNMVAQARQNKSSDAAYVVRGLDSVVLAPKENPAFAELLQGIMKKPGGSISDNRDGILTTFKNVGGFLEVAVSRNGGPITFKNVSYDRGNGKFAWNVVGLDKVNTVIQDRKDTQDNQAQATIYGRDRDLIASAVKLGQGSNAGMAVYALNNAVAAAKNSPFAQQIKDTMTKKGTGPVNEKFTDSQGRTVDVEWSKYGDKLQVKVEREGVLPTIHRVSYEPKTGKVGWVVTDIDIPKRKPVELGNQDTVLSKIGNPKSREAIIIGLIDRLYVNTAKPEQQGNREILKNLSSNGYFLDEKGNVRFSLQLTQKGEAVSVTGGKGVIAITITPADPKASPYIFRTGIDADGRPKLKDSAQRMRQYLTSDNSSLDMKTPEPSAGVATNRQIVTNLNNTKQLAMVPNATTGKIDIVDAANNVYASYKGDTTAKQIQIAMSIPGPLMNKGDSIIPQQATDKLVAQNLQQQLPTV